MPFEIGSALAKERTLRTEITLEGISGKLPLEYYPNRAEDAQAALRELNSAGGTQEERMASLQAILFSLVASWDASVNSVAVPLTSEGFATAGITMPFISQILGAVINEAYAGEASGQRLQKLLRNS